MCVVIDANTFHCTFDPSSILFNEFSPVNQWIHKEPRARLVYGGTKYKREMVALQKYFPYLVELRRLNKIAEINDSIVDSTETKVEAKVRNPKFNDAHIIAIFIVSGCRIFCSNDQRADKYLKMQLLYPKKHKRPKVYRGKKHIHLLCRKNLVELRNVMR